MFYSVFYLQPSGYLRKFNTSSVKSDLLIAFLIARLVKSKGVESQLLAKPSGDLVSPKGISHNTGSVRLSFVQ